VLTYVITNFVRVVLIAAKELAFAKRRLAPALGDSERRALAEAMFRDVLAAACQARLAERVAVVTSDRALLQLAWSAGAIGIDEGFPRGLNAAVALATSRLGVAGAATLCTVLSDIPLVTGDDIDAVFAATGAGRCAVLVPSRDFSGTNIIARSPADLIPTVFGRFSLVRHRDECRQRKVRCEVMRLARPALDLDLLSDLVEFVRIAGPTNTLSHLSRLGIASG
jgi:2-phospho-L-lactate/phosphoenolpyruvate guanylyltransferase